MFAYTDPHRLLVLNGRDRGLSEDELADLLLHHMALETVRSIIARQDSLRNVRQPLPRFSVFAVRKPNWKETHPIYSVYEVPEAKRPSVRQGP
jgi:hypothetical protein